MALLQGTRQWRAPALAVLRLLSVAVAGNSGLRGSPSFQCPTSSTVSIKVWWPPKDGASSYQLEVTAEGLMPSVYQTSAEAHATVMDLQPGTEYTVAVNTLGAPHESTFKWAAHGSEFKCRTADLKPSQVLIRPPNVTSPTELSVRLHAPSTTEGITHYEVYWKPSTSSEWNGPVNTTASVVSIAELEPSTDYDIQATAVYVSARGYPSDPVVYRTSSDAYETYSTFRLSSQTEGSLGNLNTGTMPYVLKYWLLDSATAEKLNGNNKDLRVSRYCVHRTKQPWADYMTCIHGNCTCQTPADRCFNRVNQRGCSPGNIFKGNCSCNLRYAESAVGRTPYYWPLPSASNPSFDSNFTCVLAPIEDAEPTGFSYSYPREAECAMGRPSTQACSWSSEAAVHSVSKLQLPEELRQHMSQAKDIGMEEFEALATGSWVAGVQKVFSRIERCCGC